MRVAQSNASCHTRGTTKRWLTVALSLLASLVALAIFPSPCHAEMTWNVVATRPTAPLPPGPKDPHARRDILESPHPAIVPMGITLEGPAPSVREKEGATTTPFLVRWHTNRSDHESSSLAQPIRSRRLAVPSPARARAFLMVFLN